MSPAEAEEQALNESVDDEEDFVEEDAEEEEGNFEAEEEDEAEDEEVDEFESMEEDQPAVQVVAAPNTPVSSSHPNAELYLYLATTSRAILHSPATTHNGCWTTTIPRQYRGTSHTFGSIARDSCWS
jgi:hypothetical protein